MKRVTLGAFMSLVLAGCATTQIHTDFDETASFSHLKTYNWSARTIDPGGDPALNSPLLEQRIHKAVDAELAGRGYSKSDGDEVDFHVGYQIAVERRISVLSGGIDQTLPAAHDAASTDDALVFSVDSSAPGVNDRTDGWVSLDDGVHPLVPSVGRDDFAQRYGFGVHQSHLRKVGHGTRGLYGHRGHRGLYGRGRHHAGAQRHYGSGHYGHRGHSGLRYRSRGYGHGSYYRGGSYGYPYYGYDPYYGPTSYEYLEGTLTLDIVDARTGGLIWRGWAREELDADTLTPEVLRQFVNVAVQKILERFPPPA